MIWDVLQSFEFFLPQMFFGIFLGVLLSLFGSFLVLRNMAFFGVTLSQVVTTGVALSLFLGVEGEWFAILASIFILAPLVGMQQKERKHQDTLLGILFVFFASFSQFLLSLGGNVKNQIMAAFFGDILTNRAESLFFHFAVMVACFMVFVFFYNKFLFLSFDRDEFAVRRNSILLYEILFYAIAVVLLSIGVHMLGSFYATAHLLIPAYTALVFVRSMGGLLLLGAIFSAFATILGFTLSLIGFEYNGEVVYFPTSSTIVVVLAMMGFLLRFFRKKEI